MANVPNTMGRLFSEGVLMAKYQILKKTSSVVLQSREEGSNKGLKDSNFSFGCEQKKNTQKRLIYFLNWQNRMKVWEQILEKDCFGICSHESGGERV